MSPGATVYAITMPALMLSSGFGCLDLRTSSILIAYIDLVGNTHSFNATTNLHLAYSSLKIAMDITLLFGLHKSIRKLVKVYLVTAASLFLLHFVLYVLFMWGSSGSSGSSSSSGVQEMDVRRIAAYIMAPYLMLILRSYYYEMGESRGRRNTRN